MCIFLTFNEKIGHSARAIFYIIVHGVGVLGMRAGAFAILQSHYFIHEPPKNNIMKRETEPHEKMELRSLRTYKINNSPSGCSNQHTQQSLQRERRYDKKPLHATELLQRTRTRSFSFRNQNNVKCCTTLEPKLVKGDFLWLIFTISYLDYFLFLFSCCAFFSPAL